MQKKIIALAVAGLASTAAFAQSNVTVYGVVDMYAAGITSGSSSTGFGGHDQTAINSGGLGGSRLGFKGVEDLGGGTKALFTLEYAVAVDRNDGVGSTYSATAATSTMARQQFVGLTGAYGTVVAGRLQSLVYNHNAAYNPTFGSAVDTLANAASVGGAAVAIGSAERLDNAVAYVAPKMGDVTLAGAYTANASGNEGDNINGATRAYEASATYASGPASLGLVYRNALNNGATTFNGNNSYALGGSYDLGVTKLSATYGKHQSNQNADTNDQTSVYNLGAVVPVSAAGAVILSYGTATVDRTALVDQKRTVYAALYKHNLSKRTALYGGFAQSSGAGTAQATLAGVTSAADGKVNVALAGINHSF